MSEPQRSPPEPPNHEDDTPNSRPILPPRPSASSFSYLLSEDITSPIEPHSPTLSRKPVFPRRSSRASLDKRSYSPIQMQEIGEVEEHRANTSKESSHKVSLESGHLPPKTFEKTHQFLWWNLGYWRMPARHFSIFAVLFLSTFLPIYYCIWYIGVMYYEEPIDPFDFDCEASGGWSFIGINLVLFRNFTFGEAKAVDLAWNWIVGRGLQGTLTLLAYRVFSDALLRVVELSAVPFELYATLALPSTKIELLWQVCKNLFKRGNWRAKMIFIWLIVSTFYLVAVPGLMDAATAYEVSYNTNFLWPASGRSQKASEVEAEWANYTNAYGYRANAYLNSTFVMIRPVCIKFDTDAMVPFSSQFTKISSFSTTDANITNLTAVPWPDYTNIERFGTCRNFTTNGTRSNPKFVYHFDEARLFYWDDKTLNTTWWEQYNKAPILALDESSWASWNFYPAVKTSFQCIVDGELYRWGFSFGWLFLITIANSVWLWGLWILWLDCDTNSEFCKKRRRLGVWRAIADISEAMREELGPNICAYSDDDLLKALQKRGPVKYYARRGTADEPGHLGLSTRKSGKFVIRWGREYGREKED